MLADSNDIDPDCPWTMKQFNSHYKMDYYLLQLNTFYWMYTYIVHFDS